MTAAPEGTRPRMTNLTSQFRITRKKGFHIQAGDYTVSVQFGPGNYCEHYDAAIGHDEERCGKDGSMDAEVAFWKRTGDDHGLISMEPLYGDSIAPRRSASQVIGMLAALEAGNQDAAIKALFAGDSTDDA